MISFKGPLNSGSAVGADGLATVSTTTTQAVIGRVLAIYLRYNGIPSGTTDITVATAGIDIPGVITLLSLADATIDGWFYPRHIIETNDGTDITYNGTHKVYEPYISNDKITVTIAQANAANSVDAWLVLEY